MTTLQTLHVKSGSLAMFGTFALEVQFLPHFPNRSKTSEIRLDLLVRILWQVRILSLGRSLW